MMFKKFATALALTLGLGAAHAELRSATFTPEEPNNNGWKAFLGIGGGNALLAEDGTVFANLRIGIEWNSWLATGVFASFIVDDVRNHNVKTPQMVNYNAYGAVVEFTPFRKDLFSISVPVEIAGGVVNAMDWGESAFSPEDYFFMADVAAQFNFRVTKMLEVSIGGGYRFFAGIEDNNLDNGDFNTPFGEIRFTIKE